MEIEEVLSRIEQIKKLDDEEVQHALEDELRHEVLVAIANGDNKAKELANAVLKTSDIDFPRYCS